ncbi:MAG: c-type cytochrome [Sphingomonadales bacterium]|nr:c-type cytochrome [Sphingomonadales bacterium]
MVHRRIIWSAMALVPAIGIVSAAQGEGASSALDPAAPGAAQYAAHCAACHGATLDGFDHAPPLRGLGFMSGWAGEKQRKLYSRIISTMPANDPGSLEPADVLAITQLVLRMNNVATAPAASASDLDERLIVIP